MSQQDRFNNRQNKNIKNNNNQENIPDTPYFVDELLD